MTTLSVIAVVVMLIGGYTWKEILRDQLNRALVIAVRQGNATEVGNLLNQGADANTRVHLKRQTSFLRRLILLFHMTTNDAQSPAGQINPPVLHLTVERVDVSCARLLLAHGAMVDAKDNEGQTALLAAIDKVWRYYDQGGDGPPFPDQNPFVSLLLEHGADPNTTRNDGLTPLYRAARFGDAKTVELLLAKGADPLKTVWGFTVMESARGQSDVEVIGLIERAIAKRKTSI